MLVRMITGPVAERVGWLPFINCTKHVGPVWIRTTLQAKAFAPYPALPPGKPYAWCNLPHVRSLIGWRWLIGPVTFIRRQRFRTGGTFRSDPQRYAVSLSV